VGDERSLAPSGRDRYTVRWADTTVPAELLDVDRVLAGDTSRVLQASERTTVAVATFGGRALVLKRFRERTLARVLETIGLGSGAARVFRGAVRLRAGGFEAPDILAVLERRRLGLPLTSCAIVSYVPGDALDVLWRARTGAARRRLTLAFADYLRRLHGAGLYPQDLRAANVVVRTEDPPHFVLVDLDRVRRYRRLSWRRRRKNLVQVHRSIGRGASRPEGLRFLARYLGAPSPGALRRAAAEIARLGRVKDAEYARRRAAAAVRMGETAK